MRWGWNSHDCSSNGDGYTDHAPSPTPTRKRVVVTVKIVEANVLEEPQPFLDAVSQKKSEFQAAMPEQWEDTMDMQIVLSLLAQMRQFRPREHWTRKLLEAHQADALRSLREYAYAHSPFYQQFHRGLYDAPLQELPVLTKAMMMEHFDDLVTDRAIRLEEAKAHMRTLTRDEHYLDRYWVNATSGSSGHPGLFLFNRAEWITVLASFARAREWAGVKFNLTSRAKQQPSPRPPPSYVEPERDGP